MKKQMIICLMLLIAYAVQAQNSIKVAPVMKKGETRTYVTEVTNESAGKNERIIQESDYTITDVTDDGYVMDVVCTKIETQTGTDDIASKLLRINETMMKGAHICYATDKAGRAMRILNYEELCKKTEETMNHIFDEILESAPELGNLISKESMIEKARSQMSETAMLKNIQKTTSPMALNGKTISTGLEEEFVNTMGMKMKRRYTVNGNTIVAKAESNMSKEDMKNFIIAQVETVMPGQAEMIKQNIDMMLDSNMLTFQMDEETTFELLDNGWVKSMKSVTKHKMMGVSTTTTSTVTLK